MSKIVLINNKYAKLVAGDEIKASVLDLLSVEDPQARFTYAFKSGHWDGMVRFMSMNRFPIGLTTKVYNHVKREFQETPKIVDRRDFEHVASKPPQRLGDLRLYDYQVDAVRKALGKRVGKVPFPRGIIYAATNAGKSLISAAIFKSLHNRVPCLFLAPTVEIFNQAYGWFNDYFDCPIGRYNPKILDIENITVGMITTLYARRRKEEAKLILDHFGCLIVDEAHHASSPSWSSVILRSNAYYKFALSGTALKASTEKNMRVRGLFGPVLVRIRNKELVDAGVSAKPKIRFYQVHGSISSFGKIPELEKKIKNLLWMRAEAQRNEDDEVYNRLDATLRDTRRKLYGEVYKHGIIHHKKRLSKIARIVKRHEQHQILIMVKEIAHGKRIQRYILHKLGYEIPFVSGQDTPEYREDISEAFHSGEIPVLVATMIYKEGVDVPAIDVLVMAMGEKAPITMLQTLGRGLRRRDDKKRAYIYDFYDYTYDKLEEHSEKRFRIYRLEKFKPKIISRKNSR